MARGVQGLRDPQLVPEVEETFKEEALDKQRPILGNVA
jgi:hypothetical protein